MQKSFAYGMYGIEQETYCRILLSNNLRILQHMYVVILQKRAIRQIKNRDWSFTPEGSHHRYLSPLCQCSAYGQGS